MARRKICCETANKLTRQYNHVSNSTADNGEYCCELWISSVVPYCDQCAKWNQTWIFHFYVQCTYSDQIVVMRVEKFNHLKIGRNHEQKGRRKVYRYLNVTSPTWLDTVY